MAARSITLVSLAVCSLASLIATVNAEGCYSGGGLFGNWNGGNFKFGHLHQSPDDYANQGTTDIDREMYDAIENVCETIDGAKVKPGSRWARCEDWDYIKAKPCPQEGVGCYLGPDDYDRLPGNQLIFEFKHGGNGDDERTMTKDVCWANMRKEFEDCSDWGGEHTLDGFFFRLDPNPGQCP